MSDKQSNLTDKEMEDLQSVVTDTLASVCAMADKNNIDRDSMLKYFTDTLTAFAEVASIQNYETNRTCNCQHNSNSRDNEPCCRCDSRKENREVKIVTVSDLIKILDTKENRYGATRKPRVLNLSLNGIFAGSIESVKLDGYGDGLITDVTMEITSSKFTTTNADRIRNMSDKELAEFIQKMANTCLVDFMGYADKDCDKISCKDCEAKAPTILEWLQSEAE